MSTSVTDVTSKVATGHDEEYNVDEWKRLFTKKCYPSDKVECDICRKVVTRHSLKHHINRHKVDMSKLLSSSNPKSNLK